MQKLVYLLIGKSHNITTVDSSYVQYLAQAANAYINNILAAMCKTSDHRSNLDYELLLKETHDAVQTNYELEIHQDDDVKLKLLEIENRERVQFEELMETVGPRPTEEELEEERLALEAQAQQAANAQQSSQSSNQQQQSVQSIDSKKGRKVNPKKELPEAVKNKMTNTAALMAAGGTVKSWMLPGATISGPTAKVTTQRDQQKAASKLSARTGSRLRIQKRITIKDALFVMETQNELKNSELIYKWWANVK